MLDKRHFDSFDWILDYSVIELPKGGTEELRFEIRRGGMDSFIYRNAKEPSWLPSRTVMTPSVALELVALLEEYFPDRIEPTLRMNQMVFDGTRGNLTITRLKSMEAKSVSLTFLRAPELPVAQIIMQLLSSEFQRWCRDAYATAQSAHDLAG